MAAGKVNVIHVVCHVDFVRGLNSRGTVCTNQIIIYKLDVKLIS